MVLGSVVICVLEMVVCWFDIWGGDCFMIVFDMCCIDDCWILFSIGWIVIEMCMLDELVFWYVVYGVYYLLCIDIECDGMFVGFNLELYCYLVDIVFEFVV